MRTIHTGIRFTAFAALGLMGVIACSSAGAADSTSQATRGPSAGAGNAVTSGSSDNPNAPESPPAGITDCSVGQILGISHAINQATIDRAKAAMHSSNDSAVKDLAKYELHAAQKTDERLSSWASDAGEQFETGDLSDAITRSAASGLKTLQPGANFDRQWVAYDLTSDMQALGFLELLEQSFGQPSGEEGPVSPQGSLGPTGQIGQLGPMGAVGGIVQIGPVPQLGPFGQVGQTNAFNQGVGAGYPGTVGQGHMGMGPSAYPFGQGQGTLGSPEDQGGQGVEQQHSMKHVRSIIEHTERRVRHLISKDFELQRQLVGACGAPSSSCEGGNGTSGGGATNPTGAPGNSAPTSPNPAPGTPENNQTNP